MIQIASETHPGNDRLPGDSEGQRQARSDAGRPRPHPLGRPNLARRAPSAGAHDGDTPANGGGGRAARAGGNHALAAIFSGRDPGGSPHDRTPGPSPFGPGTPRRGLAPAVPAPAGATSLSVPAGAP